MRTFNCGHIKPEEDVPTLEKLSVITKPLSTKKNKNSISRGRGRRISELQASLVYIVSSRTARAT